MDTGRLNICIGGTRFYPKMVFISIYTLDAIYFSDTSCARKDLHTVLWQ